MTGESWSVRKQSSPLRANVWKVQNPNFTSFSWEKLHRDVKICFSKLKEIFFIVIARKESTRMRKVFFERRSRRNSIFQDDKERREKIKRRTFTASDWRKRKREKSYFFEKIWILEKRKEKILKIFVFEIFTNLEERNWASFFIRIKWLLSQKWRAQEEFEKEVLVENVRRHLFELKTNQIEKSNFSRFFSVSTNLNHRRDSHSRSSFERFQMEKLQFQRTCENERRRQKNCSTLSKNEIFVFVRMRRSAFTRFACVCASSRVPEGRGGTVSLKIKSKQVFIQIFHSYDRLDVQDVSIRLIEIEEYGP